MNTEATSRRMEPTQDTMGMLRLLQMLALLLLAWALIGCSSASPYRAAEGSGFGYSERKITENHYRVNFKARGDDTSRAMDYALLRASEVTLEQAYDWFQVVNRETFVNRERVSSGSSFGAGAGYETIRDCTPLGCRVYRRPVRNYHLGMSLGDDRSVIETILEVRMGRGVRPEDGQTFDAREVYENLKPEPSN
ncbi:CC0125/CC1285 family lipoprotein [Aliidiomarina indica]|uniref:CC0125/CC1285 family lipoprotein n=1 Tax=Aliidiomarina indica TaxID=2749147 RepID=UPI00188F04FA|nr:hypothetical protein [Aliidiomarina indica]